MVFGNSTMPHATVLSVQPEHGNGLSLSKTEHMSMVHWALRLRRRVRGYEYLPVS